MILLLKYYSAAADADGRSSEKFNVYFSVSFCGAALAPEGKVVAAAADNLSKLYSLLRSRPSEGSELCVVWFSLF